MPTVVEALYAPPQTDPPRKKWTRAELAAMESSGLMGEQHVELIWGDLIDKMGKKKPHSIVLAVVHGLMQRIFGQRNVYQEVPIDVSPEDDRANEPEPDLIVLVEPLWEISSPNPRPSDLRLVVEVSDSTLSFDRTTKAELYARAGIIEYWVFDVQGRRLLVHRDPQDGEYRSVTAYREEESVGPLTSPNTQFHVSQAFEGLPK